MFQAYLDDTNVELVAVEAGGEGLQTGRHASSITPPSRSVGVAQGYKTFFFQNDEGQMQPTHSVVAGLDYIGISPILAYLYSIGRIRVTACIDKEVLRNYLKI